MPGKRDPDDLSRKQEKQIADFLGVEGTLEPEESALDTETGLPAPPLVPRPGLVVGGCRLEKLLGRGAMGEVYLALHQALAKKVAVKILNPWISASSTRLARFQREARLAANLDHPAIVRIHHAGIEGGLPFLVMEYVEGESLAQRIERKKRLDIDEALRFADGIAQALAVAHAKGVIHRDVKPANVLIDREERVKLADFGLAREALAESSITQPGSLLGTPTYMAPEQVAGGTATQKTDLYALGAVIYAMLSGHPPFHGLSVEHVLRDIATTSPRPLTKVRPVVPPRVDRVVQRLLAKDPGDRFASAAEFLEALRGARKRTARGKRAQRLLPLWVAGGATLAVALVVTLALALGTGEGDDSSSAGEAGQTTPAGPEGPARAGEDGTRPTPGPEEPGRNGGDASHGVPDGNGQGAAIEEPDGSGDELPPGEPTGSGEKVPMPPGWPKDWYTIFSADRQGLSALPLSEGWSRNDEVLSAAADARAQRFYLNAEEFLADLSVEFPDGDPGLEIRFGGGERRPEGRYVVRWEDGRLLEWKTVRSEGILYRALPPPAEWDGEAVRVRIAWFSPGILKLEIGRTVKVCRADMDGAEFYEHEVTFRPVRSALTIVSFRLESPRRPPR